MQKFFVLCFVCLLTACNSAYELPGCVTNDVIKDGYQVVYSPANGVWTHGGEIPDRIVFTKHITPGSGSYSSYVAPQLQLYLSSTYEFLYRGRLIGFSEHNLKFYEVEYVDGGFVEKELSPEQVAEIFPGLEIIKTSAARDDILEVSLPAAGKKTFLLLNDTDSSYYHYSFADSVTLREPFKSVLQVEEPGEIVFAHFGSDSPLYPPLHIKVNDR